MTEISAEIKDGILYVNDLKIELEQPALEIAIYKNLAVVVLKEKKSPDNNVVALNIKGEVVWRIPIVERKEQNYFDNSNFFHGIGVYEGELRVWHWDGCYYVVDPIENTSRRVNNGRPW